MDRSPDGHLEILVVASLAWRVEQAAIGAGSLISDSRAQAHWPGYVPGTRRDGRHPISAAGQLTHIPAARVCGLEGSAIRLAFFEKEREMGVRAGEFPRLWRFALELKSTAICRLNSDPKHFV